MNLKTGIDKIPSASYFILKVLHTQFDCHDPTAVQKDKLIYTSIDAG